MTVTVPPEPSAGPPPPPPPPPPPGPPPPSGPGGPTSGGFPPPPPLDPPPGARATTFGGDRPAAQPRPVGDAPPHQLATEVSLFALTVAAIYGFSRIFADLGFLPPLLAVAALVHGGSALLRRRSVGVSWSFLALSGAWALLVTWWFFLDTTVAGLPSPTTIDQAGAELDRAWSAFRELLAPAPVLTGFVLAAAAAVAVGAFLADWAAFRMWSTRDAVIPSLTLFVFATMLAGDRGRVAGAVLYLSAAVLFVLVHRVARLERSTGWVSSTRGLGGRALLRVGVAIVLVAVVVGAVVGPRLPGASSPAIVDWRGGDDTSGRVTVSPLVDIRSRLVQRSDTEVFRVQSPQPAYWRMTALDDFDGNIWRSSGTYDQVTGVLPSTTRFPRRSVEVVDQTFTIQALSTLWLPAAFQPLAIDATVPVRYQPDTATLIVDPEATDADGASYSVRSAVTNWQAAQLRAADPALPAAVEPLLDLPRDFSDRARDLAAEVVAGADTRYDQALALQDFFRDSGGFVYDLDIESGHSDSAIDTFLEDRRGYCEQFAGAFAAMARSVGIPARVAVGFTWGDPDPTDPGTFQVRGRNAHAWPEVYLGQYGWVGFEPTPGRGAPNAEAYTGQAPSQESAPAGGDDVTATTEAPTSSTTIPVDPEAPADEQASDLLGADALADPSRSTDGGAPAALVTLVVLLTVAALGYLLVVPGARHLARGRRRKAAAGVPAAEVGVAWTETTEHLAVARLGPVPDETHTETARRAGAALPTQADALARLAAAADAAAYGPDDLDPDTAARARLDADAVIAATATVLPWTRKLSAALDPRRRRAVTPSRHRVDRPHG